MQSFRYDLLASNSSLYTTPTIPSARLDYYLQSSYFPMTGQSPLHLRRIRSFRHYLYSIEVARIISLGRKLLPSNANYIGDVNQDVINHTIWVIYGIIKVTASIEIREAVLIESSLEFTYCSLCA